MASENVIRLIQEIGKMYGVKTEDVKSVRVEKSVSPPRVSEPVSKDGFLSEDIINKAERD